MTQKKTTEYEYVESRGLYRKIIKDAAGKYIQITAKTPERLEEKIAEYQEKLKVLEAQKTEAENLEIVQMVRALRMTPAQLSAMLSGGTIPGSMVDDNNEQEENSYEE